jgi:hypothetical protein
MIRKLERELQKAFPNAVIEATNGGHYRLRLPNGRAVTVAGTPSCRRFMRNVVADVRPQMKQGGQPQ